MCVVVVVLMVFVWDDVLGEEDLVAFEDEIEFEICDVDF